LSFVIDEFSKHHQPSGGKKKTTTTTKNEWRREQTMSMIPERELPSSP
jgi:hypothetical protein